MKISLIVASYCPGDAVNRLIDSLDAQTLPQEEFEVIFVDDGSPDDTLDRLQRIAATRPNISVHQIENSGWPSRPRNVGIGYATGEYLMFVDHDDSLYPDGLRRAYEYAKENNADILSPKESKTNDVWWGMSSLTDGNIPNVFTEERVHRLMPMVPHKLYRRSMVEEHDIRFPEGARVLWEDWFVNLDAYRHSKVVSVLADQTVYLWHASSSNTSHTFHPSRLDFWERLADMLEHIATTLSGPGFRDDRIVLLEHNLRTRVIDRCIRLVADPKYTNRTMQRIAMQRAHRLIETHGSAEVMALLPKKHRAQAGLIGAGEMELVREFHEADLATRGTLTATSAGWEAGVLRYETVATWAPKDPAVPAFEIKRGKVRRVVSRRLRRVIPKELLDHTDDADGLVAEVAVRARTEYITTQVAHHADPASFTTGADGAVALVQRGRGGVDIGSAAYGAPLDSTVWDLRCRVAWGGMERRAALAYTGRALPALTDGRAAVAYSNTKGGLTLDLAQRLRTLAIDAKPAAGPAGPVAQFRVPLTNVALSGPADSEAAMLFAVADSGSAADADLTPDEIAARAERGVLNARLVSSGTEAALVGGAALAPGRYRIYAHREGKLRRTGSTFVVDDAGELIFT